ncbi:MAG: histidine phosphatase family protein [Pseudomonadota bacterium]
MLAPGVRLIHVRHGETDWNREGRLQGQRDIPLNDTGRGQAKRNGEALRELLAAEGVSPSTLDYVSSPLSRSFETMGIVRAALALPEPWRTDERLKEVSFGDWSGYTYEELRQGDQASLVRKRKTDKWSFRPPAGETYGDLADRIGEWLEEVTRDTVAVTHGGVFRVLHGHLCGTPWHEVPSLPAPQDEFFVFCDGRVTRY